MTTEAGGAPVGSHNRANGKLAQNALKRVLARQFGSLDAGLEAAASVIARKIKRAEPEDVSDAVLEAAEDAVRTVFDRIDGKASQALTGEGGGPLQMQVTHVVVTPDMFAGFTRDELAVIRAAVPLLRRAGILRLAGPGGAEGDGAGPAERGAIEG